jgi:hypothetical protein
MKFFLIQKNNYSAEIWEWLQRSEGIIKSHETVSEWIKITGHEEKEEIVERVVTIYWCWWN